MTIDYLNPNIPSGLKRVVMPIIEASDFALKGYGYLVNDPIKVQIEIVRWQSQGWRSVDLDSGDQAGTTEGVFLSEWKGEILFGHNEAVDGHYILAYAVEPCFANRDRNHTPQRMFLWHANYHPDGGQLFFPLENKPFFIPLALPGDDVKPEDFICFRFDGNCGIYIHPNVWHEGVFPIAGKQRFFDKQGAVHARVSVDFVREFGCLLEAQFNLEK
ncbi:hypothetical protein APA_2865 [Pseudanabaena sp. lw0831]|uniref:ureidoglycolate lyase n=1 Tax=Pseudanabaena sp. lw0831 TaxID=1357935 RepID=UPI001915104C|nr:ureidoglycolate lyase [Pseudanabaena sp. lw0831]GBO54814.1 hypothetical protein APA_2865 [Pseudanabaena sp. lw0831]